MGTYLQFLGAEMLLELLERSKAEEEAYKLPFLPKTSMLDGIRKEAASSIARGALLGGALSVPFSINELTEGDIAQALLITPAIGALLGGSLALNKKLLGKKALEALKKVK